MRKTRLRIAFVLSSAVLLAILGYAWHLYDNAEDYLHPMLIPPDSYWLESKEEIYTKTGIVAIAGREFEIPISYVDGRFKNGRMENDVVLQYVLPDFKSRLEFPSKEKRRELRLDGFMAGMLLEEAAIRPALDVQVSNVRSNVTEVIVREHLKIELYHEEWYRGTSKNLEHRYDVFLNHTSDSEIVDYIYCPRKTEFKIVPHCRHKFVDNGLVYKITYNRERYLSNWQEQRAAAIAFIDSFEVRTQKSD